MPLNPHAYPVVPTTVDPVISFNRTVPAMWTCDDILTPPGEVLVLAATFTDPISQEKWAEIVQILANEGVVIQQATRTPIPDVDTAYKLHGEITSSFRFELSTTDN